MNNYVKIFIQSSVFFSALTLAQNSIALVWPQPESAYQTKQQSPQWLDNSRQASQAPRQYAPYGYRAPAYAPQGYYYGRPSYPNYNGYGGVVAPYYNRPYPSYQNRYAPNNPWNRMPFSGNHNWGNGHLPNMNMPSMPDMNMPSPSFDMPTMSMPFWN